MRKRTFSYIRCEEAKGIIEGITFTLFFSWLLLFLWKITLDFSTFEIQKLTFRRPHKNTNCYKRTPSLLGPSSLFYASCNTLADCSHSLYISSEIHNQNFPSQKNSSESQNQTFKMPLWFSNSSSVKCDYCFIHEIMRVCRRGFLSPTSPGLY